ncbi:MAG: helix-turn-helix transcriptional regulator, partial [Proteobacteria bacterium]|nr:helix-turn-helix transcriptional regulator [Pseudomonadota bacterium]
MAVETALKAKTNLSDALNELIKMKRLRDNKHFSPAGLAKAIDVDRSLIKRLLSGEVQNPRIDTLIKIVNFFVEDGFNLRVDDILNFPNRLIDVSAQPLHPETNIPLPLYQMRPFSAEKIGDILIPLPNSSPGLIIIIGNQDIEPIFKAGSLF